MTASILKGDTSGQVSLALADGFDYTNATVEVIYQGAVRQFKNCAAGQTIQFAFTAAETAPMALGVFPVTVRIGKPDGTRVTVANAGVKIAVTDCIGEVRAGSVIAVDAHGGLYGVDDLPANYTIKDLRSKINEIITKLGGGVAALCLLACTAFGAGINVQKAALEDIPNGAQVVTNATVDFTGLATVTQLNDASNNVLTAAAASAAEKYLRKFGGGTIDGNLTVDEIYAERLVLDGYAFSISHCLEGLDFYDYANGHGSYLVPDDSNVATSNMVERMIAAAGGGCDTNAVSAIITNHVASGYLCTVAAAGTLVTNATGALRDDVASAAITNAGAVAAAAASAAAAYLPLAGGTLAGDLTAKNVMTRKVTFNSLEFEMLYSSDGMNFLDYNSGCSSFLVPDDSNVATSNMVERMSDYALTGGAVLKSGEIAAIETATNLTVTLDFDDNGRGADCGAYVENTAASNVTLAVAGDFHVACAGDAPLTLPKSSTNIVWFCRVKTNVVVVSRSEIK